MSKSNHKAQGHLGRSDDTCDAVYRPMCLMLFQDSIPGIKALKLRFRQIGLASPGVRLGPGPRIQASTSG